MSMAAYLYKNRLVPASQATETECQPPVNS